MPRQAGSRLLCQTLSRNDSHTAIDSPTSWVGRHAGAVAWLVPVRCSSSCARARPIFASFCRHRPHGFRSCRSTSCLAHKVGSRAVVPWASHTRSFAIFGPRAAKCHHHRMYSTFCLPCFAGIMAPLINMKFVFPQLAFELAGHSIGSPSALAEFQR
jgi:hypothetical protein